MNNDDQLEATIPEIIRRLDAVEDMILFSIRANARFKRGQRVQLSHRAKRAKLKFKRGVTRGRVISASDSFTMVVLMDGYKRPTGFFHGFFDPIGGRK